MPRTGIKAYNLETNKCIPKAYRDIRDNSVREEPNNVVFPYKLNSFVDSHTKQYTVRDFMNMYPKIEMILSCEYKVMTTKEKIKPNGEIIPSVVKKTKYRL